MLDCDNETMDYINDCIQYYLKNRGNKIINMEKYINGCAFHKHNLLKYKNREDASPDDYD